MINLLPPQEKERILANTKKKEVIIFWFLGFFFLIISILVLFSLKIYLQEQVEWQKTILQKEEKGFEEIGIKDLQQKIKETNEFLAKVDSFYQNKIYFNEIFENVSGTFPDGIYLANLAITILNDKEPALKFSLSGFAPTRESLFEFKKNLEKNGDFKKVYFPASNWVKSNNINFSISFEIPKKK